MKTPSVRHFAAVALATSCLLAVSTPASALTTYDPCTSSSKTDETNAANEAFENLKKVNEQETQAKSNLKRQLSCLDVLMNTSYSISLPSLSSILDSIIQKVINLVCSQVNQVVNEVTGQVNQSVRFPGIPGIPGTGASGGIYVGGGSSGGNVTVGGQPVSTPGINGSGPQFQTANPGAAQAAKESWMDRVARTVKNAF